MITGQILIRSRLINHRRIGRGDSPARATASFAGPKRIDTIYETASNVARRTLLGLTLGVLTVVAAPVEAATISISCGAVGQELTLCKQGAAAWEKITGHQVTVVSTPGSSSERLALYLQLLYARADDIDVMQIDVVWPGMLANHLYDLAPYAQSVLQDHFPNMVANSTVNGRLVAMPWFTDAGLLYYRKDLLEKYAAKVPETWEELMTTAKKMQDGERAAGHRQIWGSVWQGRAYEGLTCNALEWIASRRGGTIVDSSGTVTINNPQAIAALQLAAGWVGTITPPGVLNYGEEEARGVFQSGNAVFMRNWPYAWALVNNADSPVKGKVGVAALPKGGDNGINATTLGGGQLAVSKYSKNPAIAADLVLFLASAKEQKRRALVGSFNPTIMSLYQDQEVLNANPFMASLYQTIINAVARPSTATRTKYNQVSTEFWNTVYAILSKNGDAATNVKKLEIKLNRLKRGGKW